MCICTNSFPFSTTEPFKNYLNQLRASQFFFFQLCQRLTNSGNLRWGVFYNRQMEKRFTQIHNFSPKLTSVDQLLEHFELRRIVSKQYFYIVDRLKSLILQRKSVTFHCTDLVPLIADIDELKIHCSTLHKLNSFSLRWVRRNFCLTFWIP